MMFNITRLCGGKALMAASKETKDIDLNKALPVLEQYGPIKQKDELMVVFQWKEMEVTVYPQGKVMFFPLSDKDLAVKYATEILEKIRGN